MRKIFLGFGLLIIFLLAGCISIPIGDSVLEISTDGVNFEEADANAEVVEEADGMEDDEIDSNVMEEEGVNEEDANVVEQEGEIEENTGASASQCEEHDNSRLTNDLTPSFYIPDCAALVSIDKGTDRIDGHLVVENGDWEEIYDNYKEFFGEKLSSDNLNLGSQNADLYAKLHDDESLNTRVWLNNEVRTNEEMEEQNIVNIYITQDFPREE